LYDISFLADKVHIHRWPQDTPIWDDLTQKKIDDTINKQSEKKQITIHDKIASIENFDFTSLKKIGVTIPLFKEECTLIFEAQFGELYAHIHITKKSGNYLDLFNQLMIWRSEFFSKPS